MMDLTGITLDDLHAHTRIEDGHLIWTSYASQGKFPQWRVNGKLHPARRVVWALARGALKPKHQVGVKCDFDLCVHPDCLVQRTRSSLRKGIQHSPELVARITLARRARSDLNMQIVREMRSSGLSCVELATKHDITASHGCRILRGAAWKDHSNPFAGLVAR